MKKLVALFCVLFIGTASFAQNKYKCFTNEYDIVGDLTYKEDVPIGVVYHYAGVKDGTVYFSQVVISGGEVNTVHVNTIPVSEVNLEMNNMFASRSKTEDEDGYTELTLGGAFGDDSAIASHTEDFCNLKNPDYLQRRSSEIIIGKFQSKKKLVEITDAIKKQQ